jgi:DNA-binding MarR family transcriptional regulator/GNAT superfamily N-acetyltransferase
MHEQLIERVRSFNRTVTQRVGALEEEFLSRGRPLGRSRVLWEIGPDGADVRALRGRLGLDSGYLSRLLRALEAEGLVTVARSDSDGRIRTARLTPAGLAERAELDRRSDELAASILDPLTPGQRERLAAAMAEVERLLLASAIEISVADPRHPHARHCMAEYFAELDRRFENGFDPGRSNPAADAELTPPRGLLLVARLGEEPVGCGALKFHRDAPAEIKRMWVAESVRGLGLGRRLLGELEARAAGAGATTVRLETNRALVSAIALYRSAGYREVPAFNAEPYAHHWFEKRLDAAPASG